VSVNPLPVVNPLLRSVHAPPIAEALGWIAGRVFPQEKPLIDLCQAVPGYPPPEVLCAHLAQLTLKPETARYTEIEGIAPLRQALAADIAAAYGADPAPGQVLISAGCNQAFCLVSLGLARAGDEILMPLPYYFNYQMWLEMNGIHARHLPFRADADGVPDIDAAARAITPKTRALLLISPNNPTGAVYSPATIRAFFMLCRSKGIYLILDETYRDFLPEDGAPHDLFQDRDWSRTLIHLYSFSKVFCLTGYRVGAVVAGANLIGEFAKIMDCLAICAPRIGQEAARFGLGHLGNWRREKTLLMRARLGALQDAFARRDTGYQIVSAGAFFAYLRHPHGGKTAVQVARRLADRQNLLCLPGSMFGPDQEAYLRLAFANVDAAVMEETASRLAADAADPF